jgi:hypothetical protein
MEWGPEAEDCIVNGNYTFRCPRLPLQRQTAVTYPATYYKSLAMVLPMQAKHIENELCQEAASPSDPHFDSIIERAREDFMYRSVYRQIPNTFTDRFRNTVEYLIEVGRMPADAGETAIRAAESATPKAV